MDRLTYYEGGKARLKIGDVECSGSWVDRLAAYEDTGLEPEEIRESDKMLRAFIEHNRTTEYPRTLDWLLHITKAESEGRLIVLPCKVGDTVYGTYPPMEAFGKTVFLTREEAEAALGGDGDG